MEERDIDEFIEVFFGKVKDYPKRAKDFLDRIGKHYEDIPGGIEGLQEMFGYIAERIKENEKLVEYIKNKDRSILTKLFNWMPEIFDNEYLREVVEKREEYGLSDISNIVIQITPGNRVGYTVSNSDIDIKYFIGKYFCVAGYQYILPYYESSTKFCRIEVVDNSIYATTGTDINIGQGSITGRVFYTKV